MISIWGLACKIGRDTRRNHFPTNAHEFRIPEDFKFKIAQENQGSATRTVFQIVLNGFKSLLCMFIVGLTEIIRNLNFLLSWKLYNQSRFLPDFSQWNHDPSWWSSSVNTPLGAHLWTRDQIYMDGAALYRAASETKATHCPLFGSRHPSRSLSPQAHTYPHVCAHTPFSTPISFTF